MRTRYVRSPLNLRARRSEKFVSCETPDRWSTPRRWEIDLEARYLVSHIDFWGKHRIWGMGKFSLSGRASGVFVAVRLLLGDWANIHCYYHPLTTTTNILHCSTIV